MSIHTISSCCAPGTERRFVTRLLAAGLLGLAAAGCAPDRFGGFAPHALAAETEFTNEGGVAIDGYDPVAYQEDGKSRLGEPDFFVKWRGTTWRFASEKNRKLFAASPGTYAPQYGGWCAYAMARGYTAPTDAANAWTVHGGKLYLNYSVGVKQSWEAEKSRSIPRADQNWPGLRDRILSGS